MVQWYFDEVPDRVRLSGLVIQLPVASHPPGQQRGTNEAKQTENDHDIEDVVVSPDGREIIQ